MTSPLEWMTAGQWLVLLSLLGALFCTKTDGIKRTALWFSGLFAMNYIWLKWTANHVDVGFFGFYGLRILAESIIIIILLRQINRLSKWLVWLEVCLISANALAALVAFSDAFAPFHTYKKAAVLALESLQVFGIFFCISPVYRRFVERKEKKDAYTWLARSMTQSHT